jgi:hypothetical protein
MLSVVAVRFALFLVVVWLLRVSMTGNCDPIMNILGL